MWPYFPVVVPKNVRVAQGPGLDDAGEIDGASSLDEQFLVAQNCRARFWDGKKQRKLPLLQSTVETMEGDQMRLVKKPPKFQKMPIY